MSVVPDSIGRIPAPDFVEPGVPLPPKSGQLYRSVLGSYTLDEMRQLSHIKRFLEIWSADPVARDALHDAAVNGASYDPVMERTGTEVNPAEMLPIILNEFSHIRPTPALKDYPAGYLWDRHMKALIKQRGEILLGGFTQGHNPAFDAWRTRQIKRVVGELGRHAQGHTHPVISFELSEGCSVGCWFCGISAAKFRGHWAYEPNKQMWRDTLKATVDFFGPAAATGFCYWATDPSDNPDYPSFIMDYYRATGALPQTTTAAPLKNLPMTHEIMALWNKYRTVTNRFSILNRKYLNRVHSTFTAEELIGVELVMQISESISAKSLAGRAIERSKRKPDQTVDDSTIACVTGFMVSMPRGEVQLITPTRATAHVPNGYYVLGERKFTNAVEYARGLRELAAEHISTDMGAKDRLSFRPDMVVSTVPDGLEISDKIWTHRVRGRVGLVIGETIARGDARVSDLFDRVAEADGDMLSLSASLEKLFTSGALQEQGMFAHMGHP